MNDALDLTLGTIEARAKWYRKTVLAVAVIPLLSVLAAAGFRSWFPLSGVVLVIPVIGVFLALDSHEVNRWRKQVLELRATQGLNLGAFRTAVSAHPMIPRRTLEGMLALLPDDAAGSNMSRRP